MQSNWKIMNKYLLSLLTLFVSFSFGISTAFAQDPVVVEEAYSESEMGENNSDYVDPGDADSNAYLDPAYAGVQEPLEEIEVYPHYPAQNGNEENDEKTSRANEQAYYDEMDMYANAFYGLLIGGAVSIGIGSTLLSLEMFYTDDPEFDPSSPLAISGFVFLGVGVVSCIASGIVWAVGRNKYVNHAALEFGNDVFRVSPNLVATPQFTGATFDMRF